MTYKSKIIIAFGKPLEAKQHTEVISDNLDSDTPNIEGTVIIDKHESALPSGNRMWNYLVLLNN